MAKENSSEMKDLTVAKGVGIFLVVLGHIVSTKTLVGNEWFFVLIDLVYMFHMPFFMAISGYLFLRTERLQQLYDSYQSHVLKTFRRFIIPFFAMGVFVLVGKMTAQHFLHVDKVPDSFLEGIWGLFVETSRSPSLFIWYIFVLFVYQAFSIVFFKFTGYRFIFPLVLGAFLYVLPSAQIFYLDKMMPFYVFFVFGGLLRSYGDQYIRLIDQYGGALVLAFAGSLYVLYDPSLPEYTHVKLICGGVSMPAIHYLCRVVLRMNGVGYQLLYELGRYSFSIYLFNTICIGLAKAILFKFMTWNGINFLIFGPYLLCAGILGPMIIAYMYSKRAIFLSYLGVR